MEGPMRRSLSLALLAWSLWVHGAEEPLNLGTVPYLAICQRLAVRYSQRFYAEMLRRGHPAALVGPAAVWAEVEGTLIERRWRCAEVPEGTPSG